MGLILSSFNDHVDRILLAPEPLRQKRRVEQLKKLKKYISNSIRIACNSSIETITATNDARDLDSLIEDILKDENSRGKSTSSTGCTPTILGIARDPKDETKEVYLYLSFNTATNADYDSNSDVTSTDSPTAQRRIVKVPLTIFTEKIATEFEQQLTSTALCFIADASSGLGSEILGEIVDTCDAGLVLVKEPAWMAGLALMMEQNILSDQKIDKILFGLCRLESWRARKVIGESRTVVFTLPGQSSVSNLLPALQRVFPCERHVFVYDGCVDSTKRAIRNIRVHDESENNIPDSKISDGPKNAHYYQTPIMPRSITSTVPTSQLNSISKYPSFLSKLSHEQAYSVEAWMTSVDAFLTLKDDEKESGYIPFVCRLGYLMGQIGRIGNGDVDMSELALANVLQYITGSRSRPLKEDVLKKAKETLSRCHEMEVELAGKESDLPEKVKEAIEACVFCHKGILIGDKTLLDTVQPKAEWSLKAARKLTACACCTPGEGGEDGDDMSDSEEVLETTMKKEKPLVTTRSAWADGKASFAFDPTKFTGM